MLGVFPSHAGQLVRVKGVKEARQEALSDAVRWTPTHKEVKCREGNKGINYRDVETPLVAQ